MDTLTIGNQLMAKEIASEIAKQLASANHDNFGTPAQWIFLAIQIFIVILLIPMVKKYFASLETKIDKNYDSLESKIKDNHKEVLLVLEGKKTAKECVLEHEKHNLQHDFEQKINAGEHAQLKNDINGFGSRLNNIEKGN